MTLVDFMWNDPCRFRVERPLSISCGMTLVDFVWNDPADILTLVPSRDERRPSLSPLSSPRLSSAFFSLQQSHYSLAIPRNRRSSTKKSRDHSYLLPEACPRSSLIGHSSDFHRRCHRSTIPYLSDRLFPRFSLVPEPLSSPTAIPWTQSIFPLTREALVSTVGPTEVAWRCIVSGRCL